MNAPNFDMTGRVALITGAGRGIGQGIARALASAGCAVAIQDIDESIARAEADRIVADGGRAVALGGDVTDLTLPPRCVAAAVAQLGGLHVLVNNAAIQQRKSWMEQDPAEMVLTLGTNVVSPILFCRAAAPIFKAQRWGRILNISSVQGLRGNGTMLPYSLSKSAVITMTRALARDLGRDGVTVNCIAPGWVHTVRTSEDFPDEAEKQRKGNHLLLGRVGEPTDFAGTALLLCSAAGEYITGQTISVDGGMSA